MTVSCSGMPGVRSLLQSKNGLITTDLGMKAALSSSLRDPSGSAKRYEKTASFHSTLPSMALAYGSSSSLAGLQQLPVRRRPGAMDAKAVALVRADVREVAVPAERRDLRQREARLLALGVEEAELDAFRHLREDGEVGAGAVVGGPQRVHLPRPYPHPHSPLWSGTTTVCSDNNHPLPGALTLKGVPLHGILIPAPSHCRNRSAPPLLDDTRGERRWRAACG